MATYLFFDGTARAAMEFYARVLGAEITAALSFAEIPPGDDQPPLPESMKDRIMHGLLRFDGQTLMVSDTFDPPGTTEMRGFSLQVDRVDPDSARALFDALAAGGEIRMPFGPTFWARGFGRCTDRFGVPWMVNCPA